MNIPPTIRTRLAAAAKSKGLSTRDIAAELGCSFAAVAHFFRGTRGMPLARVERLAAMLGLRIEMTLRRAARSPTPATDPARISCSPPPPPPPPDHPSPPGTRTYPPPDPAETAPRSATRAG